MSGCAIVGVLITIVGVGLTGCARVTRRLDASAWMIYSACVEDEAKERISCLGVKSLLHSVSKLSHWQSRWSVIPC